MTDYNLTLSVNHEGIPPLLDVIQGDSGRNILISVADMDITDCIARAYVIKPSGLDVYNDATIVDDKVIIELTPQMLAEVGNAKMQVSIYGASNERVTTFNIWLNVSESLQDNGQINSSTEYKTLDKLINEAEEVIEDTVTATDEANKASDVANQAAQSVNIAIEQAESAAQSANEATTNANAATEAASIAAEEANAAANAANTAAAAISYPVSIDGGGTGANTAADARANLGLTNHRTYYWNETDTSLSYKEVLQKNWASIDNSCTFMAYINKGGNVAMFEGMKANNQSGSCLFHGAYENLKQVFVQGGVFKDVVALESKLTNADTTNISAVEVAKCDKVGSMIDFAVTVRFNTPQKQIYVLNVSSEIYKNPLAGVARGVVSSGVYTSGVWVTANNKIYLVLNEACTAATLYGQYFLY